jgi:Secretion system C-terminal sorting domain
MAKHFTLQINEPCHEDWNLMSPSEQGRYCGMCQKSVVDFTNMTDTQLSNYFKLNTGNTCGRFYEDQLNHSIAIPTKTIPWLKYFFTITLPAFLFSAKAIAQKKVGIESIVLSNDKIKKDTTEQLKEEMLKEVIVYGTYGTKRKTISGAVGWVSYTKVIPVNKDTILASAKFTIEKTQLTIFPNPTTSNSIINLVFTNDFIGTIVIEIFAANGQLLKNETKNIAAKAKSTTINTNNLAAGFYICSVTETKTNVKISNEFVVH